MDDSDPLIIVGQHGTEQVFQSHKYNPLKLQWERKRERVREGVRERERHKKEKSQDFGFDGSA